MTRPIKNTEHDSTHPWPDEVFVQGGGNGVVFKRGSNETYRTAFVEAFPEGTFLRGEGETIAEADDKCWAKYQAYLSCEHGPYEPRGYENGAGFCVKCGMWFSQVCEPSEKVRIEKIACDRIVAQHGQRIPMFPQWPGLVADEQARIRAVLDGVDPNGPDWPQPTTEPPSAEEYAERTRIFNDPDHARESIDKLLTALSTTKQDEQ